MLRILVFLYVELFKVGDLCWSSERDSSMQALMRELFYFNYQSVPVAENSYMSTSGFLIAGDNVQAASILLSRLKILMFEFVSDDMLFQKGEGGEEGACRDAETEGLWDP